jgi:hypothetical protein
MVLRQVLRYARLLFYFNQGSTVRVARADDQQRRSFLVPLAPMLCLAVIGAIIVAVLLGYSSYRSKLSGDTPPSLASERGEQSVDATPATASALTSVARVSEPNQATKARVGQVYAGLPMSFEANRGRVDAQVKFTAQDSGYNLLLTPTEAVLQLRKADAGLRHEQNPVAAPRHRSQSAVLRMKLAGANPEVEVKGEDEQPVKINYLIGNDRSQRQSAAHYRVAHEFGERRSVARVFRRDIY